MVTGDQDTLNAWLSQARLLLVDDEPANLEFLRHVLATEGYGEIITISDPLEVLERFEELDPDLVITDLVMPELNGFQLVERIQSLLPAGAYLPIVAATGDHAPDTRRRALAAGARDFLTKPLSPAEVRLRVRNLMETRFLHEQLRRHNLLLESRVSERTRELEEARTEVLVRLARAAEFRDDQTGQHTLRVGRMAARLAQVLGLSPEAAELVGRAAPLHDVGKIGIPDAILLKPDRLDSAELAIMQRHTIIGANILAGSRSRLLQLAEEVALSHHERWDGAGYPHGIAGEAIPLSGRIVAVADVFDSLTHERPYKRAWTVRETLAEIEAMAGSQFDPQVVEALIRVVPESEVLAASGMAVARPKDEWRDADISCPSVELAAMAARLEALQAERDELMTQVDHLRRQVARRDVTARVLKEAELGGNG
ncbi:MAG TPA: HD domain-containing phosphohydrolase [Longimicrobiales bacterium]|nr:HD domain-containing phosphohydrolase [Longimicrobiales bacterium]